MSSRVPDPLGAARRQLSHLDGVSIPGDWRWDDSVERWCLCVVVEINEPAEISRVTKWEVLVQDEYPKGSVSVYPALHGGIESTFPHQTNNGLNPKGQFARSGKLCLFNSVQESAIPNDAHFKLAMHFEKALEWINGANQNTLIKTGDNTEFPYYGKYASGHPSIAYSEDEVSGMIWESHHEICYGIAELFYINETNLGVSKYLDTNSKILAYGIDWGDYINGKKDKAIKHAIWIRINDIPKVNNYQAPNTYGELRQVISESELSLDTIIAYMSERFRNGERVPLLLGFPVSPIYGDTPDRFAWQGLLLPKLTTADELRTSQSGKTKMKKRMRTKDRIEKMTNSLSIEWIFSDNWAESELLTRGRYTENLLDGRLLLIGAGSLGSMVSEQLVRGGVSEIDIADSDVFKVGNTSRHTLGVNDIGYTKASTVSKRLSMLRPGVTAKAQSAFEEKDVGKLKGYDLIINCTSSIDVLKMFNNVDKAMNTLLFNFSFSYNANVLYCSASPLSSFSFEEYQQRFEKIMADEAKSHPIKEMPWEGVGCWSPVFPAKVSDVARAASFAVDFINSYYEIGQLNFHCCYYKINRDGGLISSFERRDL